MIVLCVYLTAAAAGVMQVYNHRHVVSLHLSVQLGHHHHHQVAAVCLSQRCLVMEPSQFR